MARQVIKLGSSSIASRDGLALDVISGLVSQIAAAQRAGHEIILVTSGAARLGQRLLAFEGPTASASQALRALVGSVRSAVHATDYERLAATLLEFEAPRAGPHAVEVALPSAVGQPALMALYRQLAAAVGMEVCQVLVSRSDLESHRAMADLGQLLRAAASRGLLPIVNGNDATDPLAALDNDQVAVAVAVAAEASRLLFLTDVRAAYRDASLSERLHRLTPAQARAVRVTTAGTGRGGMGSKLRAAARAACCGVECVIGSAREPDVVSRSLNPRARMGTVIRPAGPQLDPGQRWIGGMAYSAGALHVNREAEESLRTGSTLFLSGLKRVDGEFPAGAVVELLDVRHPERLLGRGSVALPSAILRLLRALSPQEVGCVISILLRLRYGPPAAGTGTAGTGTAGTAETGAGTAGTGTAGTGTAGTAAPGPAAADATAAPVLSTSLLDIDSYKDCRALAGATARAGQEAFAQLTALSSERVSELADSLLAAQPQLCTAFLLDRGFLHGQAPTGPAARRAVRSIHAVHRESLVVYPGYPAAAESSSLT